MLTKQRLQRLSEIAAMEDTFLRGWRFFEFRDALDVSEMRELLSHLTGFVTLQKEKERLPAEIEDRAQLEELTRGVDWGFAEKYLHLNVLLMNITYQCAFLRMCEFCNTDLAFLAQITESILSERASGASRVVRNSLQLPWHQNSDWCDQDSAKEITIMERYSERAPSSFGHLFFAGSQSSGSNSACEFYVEW